MVANAMWLSSTIQSLVPQRAWGGSGTGYLVFVCFLLLFVLLGLVLRMRARSAQILNERAVAKLAERVRIAQALHDSFIPGLEAVLLQIHRATTHLPPEEPRREQIELALASSEEMMHQARTLIFTLRSASDGDVLASELREFGSLLSRAHGIPFSLQATGAPSMHTAVVEEVVQVGKECITNAYRHSKASLIQVVIEYRNNQIQLIVKDNGIGIPHPVLANGRLQGHWGLPGIAERVQSVRGRLAIETTCNEGTSVSVRIPVSRQPRFGKENRRLQSDCLWPLVITPVLLNIISLFKRRNLL